MTAHRLSSAALACMCAVGALLTGCADDTNRHGRVAGVDTLDNGAILVQNPAAGLWAEGEAWSLVEDLRIGSVDGSGPDVFGSAGSLSLAVDDTGHMYVLDGQAREVRVFDPSGAHVRTFGRAGAGPGEMRSPFLAGWGPDGHLWVVDQQNARYSVFSTVGEFLTSYRREIGFSMHPWPGTMDHAGHIVDVGPPLDGRTDPPSLVRVDPRSAAADTFALPNYDGGRFTQLNDAGRPMRAVSIPFAGRLVWRLDPRGYFWTSITNDYRIVRHALSGDTLMIVERAAPLAQVTPDERASALEGLSDFVAGGGRIDPSMIPSTKPPLHGFMVDHSGYLWVLAGAARPGFDVFDPDGRYLGEVPLSTPLSLWAAQPVFRGRHLYGFTLDELGVPYLVRLRIDGRQDSR